MTRKNIFASVLAPKSRLDDDGTPITTAHVLIREQRGDVGAALSRQHLRVGIGLQLVNSGERRGGRSPLRHRVKTMQVDGKGGAV